LTNGLSATRRATATASAMPPAPPT